MAPLASWPAAGIDRLRHRFDYERSGVAVLGVQG